MSACLAGDRYLRVRVRRRSYAQEMATNAERSVINAAKALRDRIDDLGQRGPALADDVAAVVAAVDVLEPPARLAHRQPVLISDDGFMQVWER